MGSEKTATRRRYGADAKALVLTECDEPGASVAKVAMAHGINANVVHRWRQLARESTVAIKSGSGEFVAMALPAQPDPTPAGEIQTQLRRGATAITVVWPVSAATEFAAWMREMLR
jgi:transposase